MAGQLIRRGERTWLVRIPRGTTVDGTRKYLNKTIRGTKKQAQQWMTKVFHEIDTGSFTEPTKQTLADFLAGWLESVAQPRLGPRSFTDYGNLIRRYIIPSLGDRRLSQLTPADVQRLYASLSARGLSPRVVRYTHAVLRSALKQAVRWNVIGRNACDLVTLPKQARREMSVLSREQAQTFLTAAGQDSWYSLWALLLTTGLRPAEAMGLKWSDLEGNRLAVQRTLLYGYRGSWRLMEPKTAKARRAVILPDLTVRALRDHKRRQNEERLAAGPHYTDHGLIFAGQLGGPVDVHNLGVRNFKRVLKEAGLPNIRMYDLRHTAATLLLSAGTHPKVASEMLGHSTVVLTMDTYSHVLPTMQAQAAETMERLLVSQKV
jgi:integrase